MEDAKVVFKILRGTLVPMAGGGCCSLDVPGHEPGMNPYRDGLFPPPVTSQLVIVTKKQFLFSAAHIKLEFKMLQFGLYLDFLWREALGWSYQPKFP